MISTSGGEHDLHGQSTSSGTVVSSSIRDILDVVSGRSCTFMMATAFGDIPLGKVVGCADTGVSVASVGKFLNVYFNFRFFCYSCNFACVLNMVFGRIYSKFHLHLLEKISSCRTPAF